jgi:6-phosphogluconolactonase
MGDELTASPPLPRPLSREGRGEQNATAMANEAHISPSPLAGEGLGRGGAAQTPEQHHFADQNAMVAALGAVVVEHLQQAIEQRGHALLAVSGGKTPAALFDWLSQQTLDWSKVIITLADDRWLPPDHADSNTRLLRQHLLQGAAAARFVPLVNAAPTPEKGLAQATERFNALPQPFDLILLGMGDDGHTASLFPCAPQLQHAFSTSEPLVAMYPQTAPYGRISLSANALRQSRQNILLISGASKQAVLQQALQHGPLEQMPVRLLWQADMPPLAVYWAP